MKFRRWVDVLLTIVMFTSAFIGCCEHPGTLGCFAIQFTCLIVSWGCLYLLHAYGWMGRVE